MSDREPEDASTLTASPPGERREIPFARPILGETERAGAIEVLSGHQFVHGPKCRAFEERFADKIGVEHAVAVSSCTAGLHLLMMGLEVGPGDEVIVPAETHVATAHAVEHTGAKPVFVDVSRDTGNIDPGAVADAITPDTRAIIVVHYLGLPCDMEAINGIAENSGLTVIEDCALAVGADYDGRATGGLGLAGSFSFYPAKHMTTLEGGMVTTDDDAIAERARRLRSFGYDKTLGERTEPGIYDVVALGHNFRMSEAHAAVGLGQLESLDRFIEARRQNSATLADRIADIDGISAFPLSHGAARSGCFCINVMLAEDSPRPRAAVVADLSSAGIGTSVHYPIPVPFMAYYRAKYGAVEEDFPVSCWISKSAISLPVGPHIGVDDMHYIADHLKDAMSGD